ncbi:hypothetical protein [Umezakia ovalisporum]|uniref:Uncharacterized protein n=1 Tax=Umezakia ovalisporum FSS-43 TaxID=2740520 RepID=A0ABT6K2H3_9CYAN|nr:hypothetical protein [Umezakia ovalisporum]MDH6056452.1 hypothetical protein [Umezakia ovalisporum FSS-43]MDH6066769.1 hypothetical protein [Umezakia ovalisporum APH033B]MDH6072668.1 hypothetical protein [Umezakia ovalisporum CobakiLakeA]MDH6075644.1 hypothetical protein [Umezakia ovalisporum CS-1034]MDH6081889.1 hypothetical protein [Umezakia ovalisporum FSS-44]
MKAKVKNKNYGLWLVAFALSLLTANSVNNSAFSHNLAPSPWGLRETKQESGKVKLICSEQSLKLLTTQLLYDLPSYANRVSQRARRRTRNSDIYSYVLVAGKPEFQPLPINSGEHDADGHKSTPTGVEQVFFTTLERQYISGKIVELQQFHWLLLTKTNTGWRLVIMFTQMAAAPQEKVISPPRDSTSGVIAQAVKAWLRDCQAGSVRLQLFLLI